MTVERLMADLVSEAVLTRMRQELRDALRACDIVVPMGHAAEAVAAALDSGSHAALLAVLASQGGEITFERFRPVKAAERLAALGHAPANRLAEAAWTAAAAMKARGDLSTIPPWDQVLPPPVRLGDDGRMLGSKSGYTSRHPDHLVAFNAVIVTRSRGAVWHGDLDVTADAEDLTRIAADLGEELHVFREFDGSRIERGKLDGIPWERAIAVVPVAEAPALR